MVIMTFIIAWYANNFSLSQRVPQLGLYSMIGFSKREIAKMLFFENFFVLIITIFTGSISGLVFSRLGYLIIARIIGASTNLTFGLNIEAFILTWIVIFFIFGFLYILDLIWLVRHNALKMVQESSAPEKEPKTRWITLILGMISITAGYTLAVIIKDPAGAFVYFFLAVLLVIFGTYFLFIAGSIFILKALRLNRRYYYQSKHFIRIGNMLTRMKQNGVGLASITILITMTLITIVVTTVLFFGIDPLVDRQNPTDVQYEILKGEKDPIGKFKEKAKEAGVKVTKDTHFTSPSYLFGISLDQDKLNTTYRQDLSLKAVMHKSSYNYDSMTVDDFNRINGTNYRLDPKEVLIYKNDGYPYSTIKICNKTYRVKKVLTNFSNVVSRYNSQFIYVVFSNKNKMIETMADLNEQRVSEVKNQLHVKHFISLKASKKQQLKLQRNLTTSGNFQFKVTNYEGIKLMLSNLLFIGILVGITFIVVTFLILYYKQLSEGYSDAKRYQTLERVGLSRIEIKKLINSQLLFLFYIPLVVATIHSLFALPFIHRIVVAFGLIDFNYFLTIGAIVLIIFFILYVIMYKLTTNVYYRVITQRGPRRE